MDVLNALFRWIHILAGIIWIGMLRSTPMMPPMNPAMRPISAPSAASMGTGELCWRR